MLRVKDIVSHLASFSNIKHISITTFGGESLETLFSCPFDKYDKEGIKPFRRRKVEYFGVIDDGLFFIKVF